MYKYNNYIQQNYFKNVKYDILRAVTMKIAAIWEAASCSCTYTNVKWNVLPHLQGKGAYQFTRHNSVTFYDIHYQVTCSITHSRNISMLCHLTSLKTVQQPTRVQMRKNSSKGQGTFSKSDVEVQYTFKVHL